MHSNKYANFYSLTLPLPWLSLYFFPDSIIGILFFCGFPNCLISKLQSLQNRSVQTVLQADYFSSFRACLDRLHWLPVALRAQFKLLWLTAYSLYFNQPAYLYKFFSIRHTHESLRSSNSGLWLHQPVSPNFFSYRSFSHIASHL